MPSLWQTSLLLGLSILLLSACQTPIQTKQILKQPPVIVRQHLVPNVPFHSQQDFFCGPTTLAEVAGFYGLEQNPLQVAQNTFIPGLEGSLQIEMVAATRQLGMLAYAQNGNMTQLLSLLAENIPVIVLQNNAIALFPQWHYAVVIGYDLDAAEFILHTGVTEAHRLNFSTFERTWQRGKYWMLVMLPTDMSSKHLDPFIYAKACQDLISTQQSSAGIAALKTATHQWPDYWLPYFLLGNYYFSTEPLAAANWFAQGLPFAQLEVSYLNNYAMLLSELGCDIKAKELIDQALQIAPDDSNLLDSNNQISLQAAYRRAQHQGIRCRLP